MEQQIVLTETQMDFIQWKLDNLLKSVRDAQKELGFKPLTEEEEQEED